MPFCKNCGRLMNSDAKFCGVCGAPIKPTEQVVQPHKYPSSENNTSNLPPPPPPPTTYQRQESYPPQPNSQYSTTYQQPHLSPAHQTMASQPIMPTQGIDESIAGVILLRKPKSMGRYDTWTAVLTNCRIIFAQMTNQMMNDAVRNARDQAKTDGKGFWGQWGDQLRASFGYAQKYLKMAPLEILNETPGNFALDNYVISEVKVNLKNISRGQEIDLHEFEVEIISGRGKYEFRMDENNDYIILLKQIFSEKVKMPFGYMGAHGVRVKLF